LYPHSNDEDQISGIKHALFSHPAPARPMREALKAISQRKYLTDEELPPERYVPRKAVVVAMAFGKPTIVCGRNNGVDYLNQHMVTSLCVTADVAELSDAISTLAMDHKLREVLGSAARQRVRREFSTSHMKEKMLQLYLLCRAGKLDARGEKLDQENQARNGFAANR
jgi:glycosyltransferase involved in cell wall biosynthesis